jgi:hypothetical protein
MANGQSVAAGKAMELVTVALQSGALHLLPFNSASNAESAGIGNAKMIAKMLTDLTAAIKELE